jgi:hypothetical protein
MKEEHKGLKELYLQNIKWHNFPAGYDWHRWGLLYVLGDYVLTYVKGDILEIGCGESSILLSKLSKKFNRICHHIEFSKSGVENMKSTKGYFGYNSLVYNCTSDVFFQMEKLHELKLAFSFIDGDHMYEQAVKDFLNVWKYTVDEGMIALHDTLPPNEKWTTENKCGTVYKLRRELEKWDEIDIFTFPHSAFEVGLSIVRKRGDRSWEKI